MLEHKVVEKYAKNLEVSDNALKNTNTSHLEY